MPTVAMFVYTPIIITTSTRRQYCLFCKCLNRTLFIYFNAGAVFDKISKHIKHEFILFEHKF